MKHLQVFLFCLIFPLVCQSQKIEEKIITIRNEFQRINSIQPIQKIELFNEEFMEFIPDGGGQLTGFFENDQLVKIIEWVGPSFGILVTEYYLKDNKIFFAYQKESKFKNIYDQSGEWLGLDSKSQETIFEGRYYFYNDTLIKTIYKGKRFYDESFETDMFIKHMNSMSVILKQKVTKKNR